ncbi:MAG TPA: lysophospholipid acyltransferase family protein [Magnetovibrio sp.]
MAPGTTLYAANHVSYLDILVLGAVLSDGVFVAKSDVASWPLFGFLARLAGSEFIQRNPLKAQAQCQALAQRLHGGDSLIVFPEGTSTDGTGVKSFKSTLFAALDLAPGLGRVQPLTLVYRNPACAWHGDMSLAPHVWEMFLAPGGRVEVIFHDPVYRADFPDRKQLAKYCEVVVRDALEAELFVSSEPRSLAAE